MPDLLDLLINLGAALPSLMKLLHGLCILMGVYLVGNGCIELYAAHEGGSSNFLSGRVRYSTIGAITSVIIGSIFVLLSTNEVIDISTRTFTGSYTTSEILIYKVNGEINVSEKAKLALIVIFSILQTIGMIAIMKSLWIFKNSEKNPNSSLGKGACFFIGGLAAWNAQWVLHALQNQMGITFFGQILN
jgi:hypothetical protein